MATLDTLLEQDIAAQVAMVRQDLSALREYFGKNGYYDLKEYEPELETVKAGFEALVSPDSPLSHKSASIHLPTIAAFGNAQPGEGDKRFFVSVELRENCVRPGPTRRSYELTVTTWNRFPEELIRAHHAAVGNPRPQFVLPDQLRYPNPMEELLYALGKAL